MGIFPAVSFCYRQGRKMGYEKKNVQFREGSETDYDEGSPILSFKPCQPCQLPVLGDDEGIRFTSGRLHREFVHLLFLQTHRETDRSLAASGVRVEQSTFHFRRTVFSSQIKSKVDHILAKAGTLWINLNIDGAPIASRSHTHPSHTQNSRLLTSSLSLGVPGPRSTQCIRVT